MLTLKGGGGGGAGRLSVFVGGGGPGGREVPHLATACCQRQWIACPPAPRWRPILEETGDLGQRPLQRDANWPKAGETLA
jgi:hypothetical protein